MSTPSRFWAPSSTALGEPPAALAPSKGHVAGPGEPPLRAHQLCRLSLPLRAPGCWPPVGSAACGACRRTVEAWPLAAHCAGGPPHPAACSGRLFNEIRSREGLAYSVSGGWAPTPLDHPGLFAASAETAQPTALLAALQRALERASEAQPSAEELQRAKQVGWRTPVPVRERPQPRAARLG